MRSRWGSRRIYEMWQRRRLWFKTASIMEGNGRLVHLLLDFDLVHNQNIVSFCALPNYIRMGRHTYLGTRVLAHVIPSIVILSNQELPIHLRL